MHRLPQDPKKRSKWIILTKQNLHATLPQRLLQCIAATQHPNTALNYTNVKYTLLRLAAHTRTQ